MTDLQKALLRAQQDDITGALDILRGRAALASPELASPELARRLRGLCLLRLGDYASAAAALAPCEEYRGEAERARAQFERTARELLPLIEQGRTRAALSLLRAQTLHSVNETIMLGCLFALRGRKAAAARAFEEALSLDRGNRDAVACLLALRAARGRGARRWFTRFHKPMR